MTTDEIREALENFKSIRFDSKTTEYGFILYRDHDGVLVSYSDHAVDYEDEEYRDIDDFFNSNELDLDEYNISYT